MQIAACRQKYSNISTHSEHRQRMAIALVCFDDIMRKPWAGGLAEHAPSTATQKHTNAHIHTHILLAIKLLQYI